MSGVCDLGAWVFFGFCLGALGFLLVWGVWGLGFRVQSLGFAGFKISAC